MSNTTLICVLQLEMVFVRVTPLDRIQITQLNKCLSFDKLTGRKNIKRKEETKFHYFLVSEQIAFKIDQRST